MQSVDKLTITKQNGSYDIECDQGPENAIALMGAGLAALSEEMNVRSETALACIVYDIISVAVGVLDYNGIGVSMDYAFDALMELHNDNTLAGEWLQS